MPFWTYMLQCRDRTLYVGHTDDLEMRLAQHQQGKFASYTLPKHPVTLVWCEEFPTRYEALAAERQIKGWRKEKKLALIRGDWDLISRLSREKKERPSTSSGRTGEDDPPAISNSVRPEPVEGRHLLIPHACKAADGFAVTAEAEREGTELLLQFSVSGPVDLIVLPPTAGTPERRDELWRHTCFEAFVRPALSSAYFELNLAPTADWALYHFDAPRTGMASPTASAPAVSVEATPDLLTLRASIDFAGLLSPAIPWELNLTAVLEDHSGQKSYWALAHPPGPPDFHHPDCFVLHLPPPTPS
ncbi:MAG TPA: GIY-YIG nuclease family protein [Allosphingosinicella sp.]|jgi:predicted GIY-YIG superfamily endonuclease